MHAIPREINLKKDKLILRHVICIFKSKKAKKKLLSLCVMLIFCSVPFRLLPFYIFCLHSLWWTKILRTSCLSFVVSSKWLLVNLSQNKIMRTACNWTHFFRAQFCHLVQSAGPVLSSHALYYWKVSTFNC